MRHTMTIHVLTNVVQKRSSLWFLSHASVADLCFILALSQISSRPRAQTQRQHPLDDVADYEALAEELYSATEARYEAYLDLFIRNANLDQPLLQSKDKAMPEEQFVALQDCLRHHPMRFQNLNDDNTFNGTRGFLLSFNERGIENMESSDKFGCLSNYFKRYRLPNTNAWVLNMVWADVPDFERELTIQRHTDDARLAIMMNYTGSKKAMPYQTNVLYVFVPQEMDGGQLEAWDYDAHPIQIMNGPQASVTPFENRMAFFRGDAQHQVRSYRAPMNDKLVWFWNNMKYHPSTKIWLLTGIGGTTKMQE